MSSRSGYIGSFLVHGGVVLAAVLFSYLRPDVKAVDAQDPLLLEVWTGDGSERAPGIPGKNRGVAEGATTGNKLKTGLPRIRALDANKLIRELKEADAKAAAEAAREEAKSEKAPTPDKSAKSEKKESLDDFRKATGKTSVSKSGKTSSSASSGKTSGKSGKTGITGSSVGSLSGKGSGEPGFGRATGKGANGGDGGSGEANKLFVGDLKGKFSDAYQPIFEDQGGGLDASSDAGIVRLLVSPSGSVSFGGWIRPPADPLMEKIVKAAIAKMPPVRRPPSGETTAVRIKVSGDVEDE